MSGIWHWSGAWSPKSLWLLLLALVLHILLRFVSDWYNNVRVLHDVEKEIMQIRTVSDEKHLLNTVVDQIAENFNFAHVNIFLHPA